MERLRGRGKAGGQPAIYGRRARRARKKERSDEGFGEAEACVTRGERNNQSPMCSSIGGYQVS
jgi:hypothetical protein